VTKGRRPAETNLGTALGQIEALAKQNFDVETGNAILAAAQRLTAVAPTAGPGELNAAIGRICRLVRRIPPPLSVYLALSAGALVEQGGRVDEFADAVVPLAAEIFEAAARLAQRVFPEGDKGEAEDAPNAEGLRVGSRVLTPAEARSIGESDPRSIGGWQMLSRAETVAVAATVRSEQARQAIRSNVTFMAAIESIHRRTGECRCLSTALAMLDNEPLLVIHPATVQGFRFVFGGVADNFQLHMLLVDALVGGSDGSRSASPLGGKRPSEEVLGVWRGEGPQQIDESSNGVWNLYQWTAVDPDGHLGEPDWRRKQHWVWNEGIPADICHFEGVRTLLLGPPAYERSWNTARFFDVPEPTFTMTGTLDPGEVRAALARMAAAANAQES
jgi:hypothetical protein